MLQKKIPYIISLILISLISVSVFSQESLQDKELHSRYEIYKDLFNSKFIWKTTQNVVGANIPLSVRIPEKNQLRWGDATIQLASYISVLATEYAYHRKRNLPNDTTIKDLYQALLALQRLDLEAEPFFGQLQADTFINGFFIRDDIDTSIRSKKKWITGNERIHSDYIQGMNTNEMSQDQVWHILLALRLVSTLVDYTTPFTFVTDQGEAQISLAKWSGIMAVLMVRQMQQEKAIHLPFTETALLQIQYWELKNPVRGKAVRRGAWPTVLKYGFAEAANQISDYCYGDCHWANSKRSANWFKLFKPVQHLYQLSFSLHKKDMYYAGALACASGLWSANDFVKIQNLGEKLPGGSLRFEHFALIASLFDSCGSDQLRNEKNDYLSLLLSAPGHGPTNRKYNKLREEHRKWSSVSRLIWPERLGKGMPDRLKGEYNGLDFMLLHNLYYLVF